MPHTIFIVQSHPHKKSICSRFKRDRYFNAWEHLLFIYHFLIYHLFTVFSQTTDTSWKPGKEGLFETFSSLLEEWLVSCYMQAFLATQTPVCSQYSPVSLCNPSALRRLCGSSGSWSGSAPGCRPVSCGAPPVADTRAVVTLLNSSSTWRSLASYSCMPGFRDTGDLISPHLARKICLLLQFIPICDYKVRLLIL